MAHWVITDLTRRRRVPSLPVLTARDRGREHRHLRRALAADAAGDGSRGRRQSQLADVTVSMRPLELTAAQARRRSVACPTSRPWSPGASSPLAVWIGERREGGDHRRRARLRAPERRRRPPRLRPGAGAAAGLTDQNNAPDKGFTREAGVRPRDRRRRQGPRCASAAWVATWVTARTTRRTTGSVLRDAETVAALSGAAGYTSLALRLHDDGRAAAERTVAAVREHLRATPRSPASTKCR